MSSKFLNYFFYEIKDFVCYYLDLKKNKIYVLIHLKFYNIIVS